LTGRPWKWSSLAGSSAVIPSIYFGSGYHGIEAASRGYFNKPARELTLGEGALIAGLIRSPNKLSPQRDLGAATAARDAVLDRMTAVGFITATEAIAAKAQRQSVARQTTMHFADDYVMDAVNRELDQLLAPEVVDFGGLQIFMTVDPQLQAIAQTSADRWLTKVEHEKDFPHPRKDSFNPTGADGKEAPTDYLQAAVVAVDNRNGAIRAIVGGRDFAHSKYSRALVSKRQVGSTFKPFVYAAAFQRGLAPGTLVDDSPIRPEELPRSAKKWSPGNSDGEYGGLTPAGYGLLKSRNTMSVRVGELAGMRAVRDLATSAHLAPEIPDLPASFLGCFESTVKDLTAAYTIFPNGGVFRPPHLISRVEDREGRLLWKADETEKRVLPPEDAWMVSSILQDVMKTGTAAKSQSLGWRKPGAGKTGTTNDFFDAWFVGYTTSLTCGVWVGMDQPQTIQEKAYGSSLALPIWVSFMKQVPEKQYPASSFRPPVELVRAQLCSLSGNRATTACSMEGCAYEARLPVKTIPGEICRTHLQPPAPAVFASASPVAPSVVPQAPPPTQSPPASVPTSDLGTVARPAQTVVPPVVVDRRTGRQRVIIPVTPPAPAVESRITEAPVRRVPVRRAEAIQSIPPPAARVIRVERAQPVEAPVAVESASRVERAARRGFQLFDDDDDD
jgi:penicillin-binding protein 1A